MKRLLLSALLFVVTGCAGAAPPAKYADYGGEGATAESPPAAEGVATTFVAFETEAADPQRKIIYEAELDLIVDDFSVAEREVPRLVKEHGGYLAEVTVDRSQGMRLNGTWVARVPVQRYEDFLEAVTQLGVPETQNQTAQDVTEEYLDLETQIANKKRLEERILELLDRPNDEIKHVLEVERELARVRSEIERMEGRLRYLQNRTALTTITIRVVEQRDYVPPRAPTLSARISRAWEESLKSLRMFGEALILLAVVLAPWLLILAVLLAIVFAIVRIVRWSRRRRMNAD
jgi:hypothetical protein